MWIKDKTRRKIPNSIPIIIGAKFQLGVSKIFPIRSAVVVLLRKINATEAYLQHQILNFDIEQGVKHTIKTNSTYFLTLTVRSWADVFTGIKHKQAIINALRYCIAHKGLNVYAYCLMTNHLHLIVNCNEPFQLSNTIRDFKRYTAIVLLKQIFQVPDYRRGHIKSVFENSYNRKSSGMKHFWKEGNHAIEIYSGKFLRQKLNYIHNNPVVKEYVKNPEHWLYSSATNYMEKPSILPEVEVISCFHH